MVWLVVVWYGWYGMVWCIKNLEKNMKTVERQLYSKDSLDKMIGGKMYGSVASGRSGQVGHVGHLV